MLGPEVEFLNRDYLVHDGKKLLYLGGIDYHRMSNHPLIIDTVREATQKYGINPTGSRTTTGNHIIYKKLENKIAEFFGAAAAAVFTSGYLSNIILLQAIADEYDIFFIDEVSHSSIADAVKQFGKKIIKFKFLDAQDLSEKLEANTSGGSRVLVMTDGVFPARGDIPPLEDYAEIVSKYNGKLMIDDAHAMAVVGETGKGSWEVKGLNRNSFFQTGTLSKGFGTLGGLIQGDSDLIDKIHKKSLAFSGSTGLALPLAAAAIKSISYLTENRKLITDLQERTIILKKRFADMGFVMPNSPAPIFSITLNDELKNKKLEHTLLNRGIYPPFINYPGAPPGGHFRFIITSSTTELQIELLVEAISSAI